MCRFWFHPGHTAPIEAVRLVLIQKLYNLDGCFRQILILRGFGFNLMQLVQR